MPITNIGRWSAKNKEIAAKKRATHARKVEKITTITTSDLKRFCDVMFEARRRWECNWKSVISGRSMPESYENIHCGHYISRGKLATRYEDMNGHAITSWENHQQSLGNRDELKKYDDFMIRTYGTTALEDLKRRSEAIEQWNWCRWTDKCKELYTKAINLDEQATGDRLTQTYRTLKEKRVLELIMKQITMED